jgi:hypothetical protein
MIKNADIRILIIKIIKSDHVGTMINCEQDKFIQIKLNK